MATSGESLAPLAETIQAAGGYVVQAEFRKKTGSGNGNVLGIEHRAVIPGLTVMVKGTAGGMLMGATVSTTETTVSWFYEGAAMILGLPWTSWLLLLLSVTLGLGISLVHFFSHRGDG